MSNVSETEALKNYYSYIFPFSSMIKWIGYSDEKYLRRREWSFTTGENKNIYSRYLSFGSEEDLRQSMLKKLPYKIDIGAVFNVNPADHGNYENSAFLPQEKELVFDIDLTDYDPVRTCCSGANICGLCWEFMIIAVKVLDKALRNDFGFEHLLWVYSGRRGIHCWVCDPRARKLTNEVRFALGEYLTVIKGQHGTDIVLGPSTNNVHPSLERAYHEILLPHFTQKILTQQKILDTEESQKKVLAFVMNDSVKKGILEEWSKQQKTTKERWDELIATLAAESLSKNGRPPKLRYNPTKEIVFAYTYPRLDINVTRGVNHLLKSPFCVHPSTGKVCIPFDPKNIDTFDPQKVPEVKQLTEELNKPQENAPKRRKGQPSVNLNTSMKPHLDFFTKFVNNLEPHGVQEVNQEKSMEW